MRRVWFLVPLSILVACGGAIPTAAPFAPTDRFRDVTREAWQATPRDRRIAFLAAALSDYTGCDLTPDAVDAGMATLYRRDPPVAEPPVKIFAAMVVGAGCGLRPGVAVPGG